MLTNDQAVTAERVLRRLVRSSYASRVDHEDVVQSALLRLCECGRVRDGEMEDRCRWAINAPVMTSYRRAVRARCNARAEVTRLAMIGRLLHTDDRSIAAADAAEDLRTALGAAELSEREWYVVLGVLRGRTHRTIARELGISRPAVTQQLHRVYRRIADLVRFE